MTTFSFKRGFIRSRATIALLLISVLYLVAGCSGGPGSAGDPAQSSGASDSQNSSGKNSQVETASQKAGKLAENPPEGEGDTVESILPEDILSEKELAKGAPKQRDWSDPAAEDYTPATSELFVSSDSSTGAIPSVKPFNFGRDPGGPDDKTLYLTVPKLGLDDVPIYDSLDEEKLTESAVHVPATGFPWQKGANTFIAGHRIGYEGTGSLRIFYDVPSLVEGDEIIVEDSAGGVYTYRVTGQETVGPGNVESMNPVEGKSVISLQTCTLPDYAERIIVQGELVEGDAA